MKKMQKIQFIYFRNFDEYGDIQPNGGVTVSYIPGNELPSRFNIQDNYVAIGASVCSVNDNFCKNIGRGLAINDAVHNFIDKEEIYEKMTMEVFFKLAHKIYNEKITDICNHKIKMNKELIKDIERSVKEETDMLKSFKIVSKVLD